MPYVNVALDSFGLIIVLIIMAACIRERLRRKHGGPRYFLILLISVSISLAFDIVCGIVEGNAKLGVLNLIFNTLASCAGQISIMCFLEYLCDSLYVNNKRVSIFKYAFRYLCVASLLFAVGNAFFGYSFVVNEQGHYVSTGNIPMLIIHLIFSMASLIAVIPLVVLSKRGTSVANRILFIIYAVIPAVGIILDYAIHESSFTYVGTVISVLIIYTNIYLEKQKLIDEQKSAIMLSQINPHFIYNTLTTIAAMCDSSPSLAKSLTLDFSRFLRRNLDSLTSETPVSFYKELEHIECYLKIEQARFRERLRVIWSIQCTDFYIPPLTVQPIVENAVKHGITKKVSGGTVKISSYSTDKNYVIEVIDDGVGFDVEALMLDREGHVGLENVEARLKRMCGGKVTFKSEIGIGTRVTLEIPLRKVT